MSENALTVYQEPLEVVDAQVVDEAANLGRSSAEMIYTKEGRQRTESILEKIRNALKLSPTSVVTNESVLFNIKGQPLSNYDPQDEREWRLIERALGYVNEGSTTVLADPIVNTFKMQVQDKGFKEGFDDVVSKSEFKDEKPEDKPWYIKKK